MQSFCRKKRISVTIYMYHMHEMLLIFIIQNKCSLIIINVSYEKNCQHINVRFFSFQNLSRHLNDVCKTRQLMSEKRKQFDFNALTFMITRQLIQLPFASFHLTSSYALRKNGPDISFILMNSMPY